MVEVHKWAALTTKGFEEHMTECSKFTNEILRDGHTASHDWDDVTCFWCLNIKYHKHEGVR